MAFLLDYFNNICIIDYFFCYRCFIIKSSEKGGERMTFGVKKIAGKLIVCGMVLSTLAPVFFS